MKFFNLIKFKFFLIPFLKIPGCSKDGKNFCADTRKYIFTFLRGHVANENISRRCVYSFWCNKNTSFTHNLIRGSMVTLGLSLLPRKNTVKSCWFLSLKSLLSRPVSSFHIFIFSLPSSFFFISTGIPMHCKFWHSYLSLGNKVYIYTHTSEVKIYLRFRDIFPHLIYKHESTSRIFLQEQDLHECT